MISQESGKTDSTMDGNQRNRIYQEATNEVVLYIEREIEKALPQLLEKQIDKIREQVENEYKRQIEKMETQINGLQKEVQSLKKMNTTSSQKRQNTAYGTNQRDSDFPGLSNLGYSRFEYSGWIFYINEKMGDCLYKVRIDGTDNTRLTDFSVFSGFKVRNGYLFFDDKDLNAHKIKI